MPIRSRRWRYDGRSLILAVICQRVWAPETVESQRFACVVTVSHESEEVDLYARFRAHAEVRARRRVRV